MNVNLASRLGISSLLVDLVSNDSGDVTLVTRDGKVTTNRLLLFLRWFWQPSKRVLVFKGQIKGGGKESLLIIRKKKTIFFATFSFIQHAIPPSPGLLTMLWRAAHFSARWTNFGTGENGLKHTNEPIKNKQWKKQTNKASKDRNRPYKKNTQTPICIIRCVAPFPFWCNVETRLLC